VNNALRSAHMVDHTCRPVYYHEPRWAYDKIWLTEMEVPAYVNILMALFAWQGMSLLFEVISQGQRTKIGAALGVMTVYVVGSVFNLVHYTIEPPTNYGPFPNLTIAGTALTTLPIIFFMIQVYRTTSSSRSEMLIPPKSSDGVRASGRKRAPVNRLSY